MKNCKVCGTEMDDNRQTCPSCNAEQVAAQQDNSEIAVKKPKKSVVSIVGFAFSVLSIALMIFFVVNIKLSVDAGGLGGGLGAVAVFIISIFAYFIPTAIALIVDIVGISIAFSKKHSCKWFGVIGLGLVVLSVVLFLAIVVPSLRASGETTAKALLLSLSV